MRLTFETVDPLFALAPLTSDVEHLEVEILEGEVGLDDAGRLHASPQHVLLRRNVARRGYPEKRNGDK